MGSKAQLIKKLNEVCEPSCASTKYCLLKEIITCSHDDPRFLVQLKVIEMFKWEESEREKHDIGWDEAHMQWVLRGYAKKFADVYANNEDLNPTEIYKLVTKEA